MTLPNPELEPLAEIKTDINPSIGHTIKGTKQILISVISCKPFEAKNTRIFQNRH